MTTEKKVLLLALLKKEKEESLNDILAILESSGVFTMKEGKRIVKELKKEEYIKENQLTLKGVEAAKNAEAEFRL